MTFNFFFHFFLRWIPFLAHLDLIVIITMLRWSYIELWMYFFFRLQINDSLLYWWNDNDYRFNCLWQWCGSMKNREKKTPKPNQTERNGTKTVFWRKSIESWMKKKLVLFIVVIIYGAVGIVGICHRQSPNGATKESIKFLRSVGEKKKNNSWLSFPSIDGSWVMICVGFCKPNLHICMFESKFLIDTYANYTKFVHSMLVFLFLSPNKILLF